MNNPMTDVVEVDDVVNVEDQYWHDQRSALINLKNKTGFKTLVDEGYFQDYVKELLMELIDPSVLAEGRRNNVIEKLVGVAKFQQYMDMVEFMPLTEEQYEMESTKLYVDMSNKVVKLNEAMNQMEVDQDFDVLVTKGYCTDYAAGRASLITNEAIVRNGKRSEVLEALAGISVLRNYFVKVRKEYVEVNSQFNEEVADE
jgi:hypothetical protein